MIIHVSPIWRLRSIALATMLTAVAACSDSTQSHSDPLVTSVDHTVAKRQSIGNCWLYAQATWLESLSYSHTGQQIDVSESYWTWWHWYDQLAQTVSIGEIQTGGWWHTSNNILLAHGWVLESEFIEEEAGVEMSKQQQAALDYINKQLKPGGKLSTYQLRTAANVRAELDKAFGVSMASAEAGARKASQTVIGKKANGSPLTVVDALQGDSTTRWNQVNFPRLTGKDTLPSAATVASRKALFKRVMRALNDRKPVVMTVMIDFNGLDKTDQTFKKSLIDLNGIGNQGGHMVVLDDYVVENVPGIGTIGEGDVSEELKIKALQGDLVLLNAKNSWGTNRPDRGLTDGYTRFDRDYLTKQLEWKSDFGNSFYTSLKTFVLPPGY